MRPKYSIDFDKVLTFEDLKLIIQSFDIGYTEEVKGIEKIRHLLKPYEDAPRD